MKTLSYPASSLISDYVRGISGLAATIGPLIFLDLLSIVSFFLLILAFFFTIFMVRTVIRQVSTFEFSNDCLKVQGPLRMEIPWSDLEKVELRYYSTRRDRSNGWMQLSIKGRRGTIRVDSTLCNFSDIVSHVSEVVDKSGFSLSPSTLQNMRMLNSASLK